MKKFILLGCLFFLNSNGQEVNKAAFGAWAISFELFQYIRDNLEEGKTILELGSGSGTGELAKFYKLYSIEDDVEWLNKYSSNYIHAPIVSYKGYRWYDIDVLKDSLTNIQYDLILVDGPLGAIGRKGFLHNIHLFDTSKVIVFDDLQRIIEYRMFMALAKKLKRNFKIFNCADGKKFGIIS